MNAAQKDGLWREIGGLDADLDDIDARLERIEARRMWAPFVVGILVGFNLAALSVGAVYQRKFAIVQSQAVEAIDCDVPANDLALLSRGRR